MKIGFDLDKVFINYPPFIPDPLINALYKKRSRTLTYRLPNKTEQLVRIVSHYSFFRPSIKENVSILSLRRKRGGHKFFLISSRFSFLKKRTEKLVAKHSFSLLFDELFFNYKDEQPHEFKNKIIKRLKIRRYIDDDLALLKYLASKNKNCTFYWLNHTQQKKLTKNLIATRYFEDVFK